LANLTAFLCESSKLTSNPILKNSGVKSSKPPSSTKKYDVLVAEFSYNSEFRDRVSNIESLLATLESHSPKVKIIVLYDEINQTQLEQLKQRYRIDMVFSFPIDEQRIKTALIE
jgi:hypothetical protein